MKVVIVGYSGRMGGEILSLASELGITVVGGVSSRLAGLKPGVVASISQLSADACDAVIDFSLPELTPEVISWCMKARKPLVSGVTGVSDEHKAMLKKAGEQIPVLWAPNMSLGVAVMARMLSMLSHLNDFEFQIEELHHKRKKDKPSGTALFLQERLTAAVKTPVPEPLAIRGGGIFGIHRVWAMGEEETVTLEHTAMNRRVFARGALKAAEWILSKPSGFYRMDDVLGT